MKLKLLRFIEELLYTVGSYFGDYADSIDTEFHETLRQALNDPPIRWLSEDDS